MAILSTNQSDSSVSNVFTSGESSKRHSKGGLGYDIVLEEPRAESPVKMTVLTPNKQISAEEIARKLKEADERRASFEAAKVNSMKQKESHIEELSKKRSEFDAKFKELARESMVKKMEAYKENRENFIKSIQEKNREHVLSVENKRRLSADECNRLSEQITKKLDSAAEARESYIQALRDRLKEHEKHVIEVRLQLENQTEKLKESFEQKLQKATENRDAILKELQDKLKDQMRHIEQVRVNKERVAAETSATNDA